MALCTTGHWINSGESTFSVDYVTFHPPDAHPLVTCSSYRMHIPPRRRRRLCSLSHVGRLQLDFSDRIEFEPQPLPVT